ncbi:MAG: type II secretion system protein GspE, partial [Porticoccaceae bacterium]
LCTHCRKEVAADEYQSNLLNIKPGDTIYESQGCEHCNNTGFVGRQALFELVTVSAELQSLIHENAGEIELEQAIRQHVPSIREAGFELVRQGATTVEEVLRVTSV